MSYIVKVYADLIEKGEKTLDQVPLKYREQVYEELVRRGYYPELGDQNEE
ncbi:MAG: hypothetical protein J6U54_09820 [Clostridiales bacterium]|nr:hypothetical protein [Clostridiales bacterium]